MIFYDFNGAIIQWELRIREVSYRKMFLLKFANDIKFNGGNSTNGYEEYIRLDASTVTIDISKNVNIGADLIMRKTKVLFR